MASKGVLRAGRGCPHQIFTLKQIGERAREKKLRVYVGFMGLEKAYDCHNCKNGGKSDAKAEGGKLPV